MTPLRFAGISSTLALLATPLAHAAALPGAELGLIWAEPFLGLLLSIALFPLIAPAFWHHHFGKISALWAAAFLLPAASIYGIGTAGGVVIHALVDEYIPFIVLLFALYTPWGNQLFATQPLPLSVWLLAAGCGLLMVLLLLLSLWAAAGLAVPGATSTTEASGAGGANGKTMDSAPGGGTKACRSGAVSASVPSKSNNTPRISSPLLHCPKTACRPDCGFLPPRYSPARQGTAGRPVHRSGGLVSRPTPVRSQCRGCDSGTG